MRKMLVFLLLLAVAGSMFAVDLGDGFEVTGEVISGLGIFTEDDGIANGDDNYVMAWNDDGEYSFRGRLNLGWTGDIGGTKVQLESWDTYGVTLSKAFGWVNLFGDKVVIWGGHGVDDIYATGGVVDEFIDSGDMVRLELRPIDGLSLSYGFPISPLFSPDEDSGVRSLNDILGGSWFGAKYSNDIFTALASFRLDSGRKGAVYYWSDTDLDGEVDTLVHHEVPFTDPLSGETYEKSDSYLEAMFALQVPDILPVGIDITGVYQSGAEGYFRIAPAISFEADKFGVYIEGDIDIDLSDDGETPTSEFAYFGTRKADIPLANPSASEGDPSIGIELGVEYQLTDSIGVYLAIGSDNVHYLAGNGIFVKPGAVFEFSPNISIEIFDKFGNLGAGDVKNSEDKNFFTNQFQIDFVWSF
ncbi:hypothetical protein LQZ19_04335 [Treponema primitia]|uniref:hypothetical protein n=1 Tax=Treponema primitia TaxID=88058 RepID=UPI0039815789